MKKFVFSFGITCMDQTLATSASKSKLTDRKHSSGGC